MQLLGILPFFVHVLAIKAKSLEKFIAYIYNVDIRSITVL